MSLNMHKDMYINKSDTSLGKYIKINENGKKSARKLKVKNMFFAVYIFKLLPFFLFTFIFTVICGEQFSCSCSNSSRNRNDLKNESVK